MPLLATHRFTVEEFVRMVEQRVIPREARMELIAGDLVDMLPIGPFHNGVVWLLHEIFSAAAHGRWKTGSQGPLRIGDASLPQPDLVLLRPDPKQYQDRHATPEDVFLVIEVADSSLAYDRKTKLPLYGRAGVPEVWIFNLKQRKVEIHREPDFNGYGTVKTVGRNGKVSPLAFPEVAVALAEVFTL